VRGPYAISASQTKRDFRASGRIFRVRFSGNSAPTFAREGKHEFDIIPTGEQ
jgi:hypothetical protein